MIKSFCVICGSDIEKLPQWVRVSTEGFDKKSEGYGIKEDKIDIIVCEACRDLLLTFFNRKIDELAGYKGDLSRISMYSMALAPANCSHDHTRTLNKNV